MSEMGRPKRGPLRVVVIAGDRLLLRPLLGLAGTAMITGASALIASWLAGSDPLAVFGVVLMALAISLWVGQALYKRWGIRPNRIRRVNLAADQLTRHLRLRAIRGAAAAGESPPARDVEWARLWRGGSSHDGETVAGYYEGDLRQNVVDPLALPTSSR
jgi:hypothetical protein